MNYEQFVLAMMECVKGMLPESAIVERQEVLKNNGVKAIGISIRENGNIAAPIIYLKEFYDVLHSTGHKYIINDIDIYLKSRGVSF